MKNLRINKKVLPMVLSASLLTGATTGCSDGEKCTVPYEHAHLYQSDEGYLRYLDSEKEIDNFGFFKFRKTPTVSPLSKEIVEMEDFYLLKIEDNLEALEANTMYDVPYIEYEIRTSSLGDCDYLKDGEESSFYTGRIRDCTVRYQGVKIETMDKGKRKLFYSELVDDLTEIKDEYPYFCLSNYKKIEYSEPYVNGTKKVKIK